MPKFDDSTIARNLAIAAEYFKAYYTVAYKKTKFSGGTTGFIPFNIEFTIDGLSGIKIYNKLRVDTSFLPAGYTKTLDFIVTGIEHKLKDGDWETVIKTTMIPKLSATEVVVTSANFKYIAYKDPVKITPVVTPVVLAGDVKLSSTVGDEGGVYHSPPKKADAVGEYVDVMKTADSKSHLNLARANGGLFPIKFYTKPGDTSGTLYSKVVRFNGARNEYEADPEFNKNLVQWKYTGANGFTKSATVNKLSANTLTQMAQHLEAQGWWNSTYILSWDSGIIRRDITPASGIVYGSITNHAFGMAIDINAGAYPLGSKGKQNYDTNIAANVPTALALDSLNKTFSLTQGGEQKVFWLYPSDTHHFSIFQK